jgi:translation initiation factor IF-1
VAEVVGVVVDQRPSSLYTVKLEGGATVVAHLTAPTERNFVRILVGDRVRVELSPVDAGRGRIVGKL